MRFGKRRPWSGGITRRGAKRPNVEVLEGRPLLATIDLGGVTPPSSPNSSSPLPNIATVPYGIDMAGGNASGGAGWSVTDVGDVTGDGFDDFVVSAPSVVASGGQVSLGNGPTSTVYLIFGSSEVGAGNIDWLLNNATQRVGDLVQLGNASTGQNNPINVQPGYAFNGIKFITSQQIGSQLGASVAAAGVVNGANSFLIGAPGASSSSNPAMKGGRAYLIYGGTNLLSLSGRTIDLDATSINQGLNFVTFVTNVAGAKVGASVAGPGDVLADQTNDIAIGAPGATYNGNAGAGVAFLIDGSAIPTGTATVSLDSVGQTGGTRGVVFGGTHAGDQTGASLAGAGDVNGALGSANTRIHDLLIGAPGAASAYLVYGGNGLAAAQSQVGGLNSIALTRLGAAGTAPDTVLGATFAGEPGDGTGLALSTAGDFNADGNDDLLIGSPFFNGNEGRVTLFYGQKNATNHLFGTISLDQIPTNDPAIQYSGAAPGALAGYSVAAVGRINLTQAPNPILIGSPGFAGNTGAAYLIPGSVSTPVGVFSLATASAQPVAATVLTLTTPGGPSAPFFGASVSGRLTQPGQTATADGDLIGDFIIGAPGYAATAVRGLAGGAFILEGALVPVQTPVNTGITITTTTIPNATAGAAYSQQIATSGGTSPITFAVTAGTLPNGLSLSSTGLISGTPTTAGSSAFTVTATDAAGATAEQPYTLTVSAATTTGPTVTDLQRFGFHDQPTIFVLTFSTAMNPGPAQTLSNYTLVPLVHGVAGPSIALSSAVYDATNHTVTLTPAQKVYLYGQYQLTVNGTSPAGLTDTSGNFLAGANSQPGTNYVKTFGKEILAGPNVPRHTPTALANFIKTNWPHERATHLGSSHVPSRRATPRPARHRR